MSSHVPCGRRTAIAPATFTHAMIGRTGRLLAPYPADQVAAAPPDSEEDPLSALRAAEQAALLWESAAHRAERRA